MELQFRKLANLRTNRLYGWRAAVILNSGKVAFQCQFIFVLEICFLEISQLQSSSARKSLIS